MNDRTIVSENKNEVTLAGEVTKLLALNVTSREISPKLGVISTVLAYNDFVIDAPPNTVNAPPFVPLTASLVL